MLTKSTTYIHALHTAAVVANHDYVWVFLGVTVLYAGVALWAWMFPETRGLDIEAVDAKALRAAE